MQEVEAVGRLAGKAALVTGGSRGIGAAIAARLAQDGASVVINYVRSRQAAQALVADIESAGGQALAIRADITRRDELEQLFKEAMDVYGRLDVLVNNAGDDAFAALARIDEAHIDALFDLNLKAAIFAAQRAAECFGEDGGRIINISSIIARTPQAERSIYSASKAALEAVTVAFAAELGPHGVTVNAVAPGSTETDLTRDRIVGAVRDAVVANTPLGRLGQPEDIAALVAFLASEEGAWITGQVIAADGGRNDL